PRHRHPDPRNLHLRASRISRRPLDKRAGDVPRQMENHRPAGGLALRHRGRAAAKLWPDFRGPVVARRGTYRLDRMAVSPHGMAISRQCDAHRDGRQRDVHARMKILYFAWLRERLNRGEEEVSPPPEIVTIADLIAWLRANDEAADLALQS